MQIVGTMMYERLCEIGAGEGRNSKVYLVDEPQLGGRVAIKEIEKASFPDPSEYFSEAQTMYQTIHENVVPIRYACETSDAIALAMPYYTNGSLARRIADGPLQLSEALRVVRGVLAGLAHVHLSRFIHFDVKPSNVMFSDTNVPMVADFGQSRAMSPGGMATAGRIYTAAFPPETFTTGGGTVESDIYQTGLLAYRAVNGDLWYRPQTWQEGALLTQRIVRGKFPNRDLFMPHVPDRIRTLIRKALRVDPTQRFHAATEMADAFGRVALPLDWSVKALWPGFRWRALRPGLADLVVELNDRGSGRFQVRSFTERAGEPRRAKGKGENWRTGLTWNDAMTHLRDVFRRLPG